MGSLLFETYSWTTCMCRLSSTAARALQLRITCLHPNSRIACALRSSPPLRLFRIDQLNGPDVDPVWTFGSVRSLPQNSWSDGYSAGLELVNLKCTGTSAFWETKHPTDETQWECQCCHIVFGRVRQLVTLLPRLLFAIAVFCLRLFRDSAFFVCLQPFHVR